MHPNSKVYKYYLLARKCKKSGLWGVVQRRDPPLAPNVKYQHSKLLCCGKLAFSKILRVFTGRVLCFLMFLFRKCLMF